MRLSIFVHACLLCCTARLEAAVFVVDTTSDPIPSAMACTLAGANDCSLRGALQRAENTAGFDTVTFDIPMSDAGCVAATGICTIRPASELPSDFAGGRVDIDGTTQPGWMPNNLGPDQGGSNAQLKIVLSGTSCGGASGCEGLKYFLTPGTVRGLVINGFRTSGGGGSAVSYVRNGGGVVEGCFIGTDATGTIAVPNGFGVVFSGNPFGGDATSTGRVGGLLPAQRNVISGNSSTGVSVAGVNHVVQGNLIGTNAAGTAALGNRIGVQMSSGSGFSQFVGNATAAGRNVISGNTFAGINLGGPAGSTTNGHRIVGNFIGTDSTGVLPLGNGVWGIQLGASPPAGAQPALVGGTLAGEGNVIAFNGTQGVATSGQNGQVAGNRIFRNGQLGISSTAGENGSATGRRVNDLNDADGPPAGFGQNYPDIGAFTVVGGNVDLSYRVDSALANSTYPLRIEFFKADGDEGRDLLGFDSYLAGQAQSVKAVNLAVPAGVTLTANDVIVATATDANGHTSEFSFSPATLAIQTPVATPCTSTDSVFCNGFEGGAQQSLAVRVGAAASSGPFAPNGVVNVTDNRGGSCNLTLMPTATPLNSEGTCILVNSGAAGPITITATLDTFRSAFGSASGGNVIAIGNFIID